MLRSENRGVGASPRPAPTNANRMIAWGRQGMRLAVIACIAMLMTGCMRAHQLESLCDEIADQCPGAHFSREFSVSLGPISLGLARLVTGFSDDTREAREYLSGVSRVQLAIYEVSSAQHSERLKLPKQLQEMIDEDGWQMVVKSSERDETAWILFREDDGKIKDMQITALDDHDLVMIRVSGHLDELFEKAMKEHGSIIDKVRNKVGDKARWGTESGKQAQNSDDGE